MVYCVLMLMLAFSPLLFAMESGYVSIERSPSLDMIYQKISEYTREGLKKGSIVSGDITGGSLMSCYGNYVALYSYKRVFLINQTINTLTVHTMPQDWPVLTALHLIATQKGNRIICGDLFGSLYALEGDANRFNKIGMVSGPIESLEYDGTFKMLAVRYKAGKTRCQVRAALCRYCGDDPDYQELQSEWKNVVDIPCIKSVSRISFDSGLLQTTFCDGNTMRWGLYVENGQSQLMEYDDRPRNTTYCVSWCQVLCAYLRR